MKQKLKSYESYVCFWPYKSILGIPRNSEIAKFLLGIYFYSIHILYVLSFLSNLEFLIVGRRVGEVCGQGFGLVKSIKICTKILFQSDNRWAEFCGGAELSLFLSLFGTVYLLYFTFTIAIV